MWRSLDDVPTEGAHGRLAANWAVTGGACEAERAFLESAMVARSGAILEGDLARAVGVDGCEVACLGVGAPVKLLGAAASLRRWNGTERLEAWFSETCGHAEVGWLTYGAPATLFWVSPKDGSLVWQADLVSGESNTHWRTALLGHRFVVQDTKTEREVAAYDVTHDAVHVVSPRPRAASSESAAYWEKKKETTLRYEETRAAKVKRSWTKHGFDKAALPEDLWADMATYWFNNRRALSYEEWDGKGASQGSKRVRKSQLQRLISRSFSTRFG